ncbi:MAG: hypothetical protein ACRER2_03060 [Methylococcales bacterium]
MMEYFSLKTFKGIGIAISLYTALVWIFYITHIPAVLLHQPIAVRQSLAELLPFPLFMIVLSLITAWASLKARPRSLAIFVLLNFISGGYYLLNATNWYTSRGGVLSLVLFYVAYRLAVTIKE